MANLQQVNFQYLDSSNQDPTSQNDRIITAIHRRSGIIVTYVVGHGLFEFYECKQWNDLQWKPLGSWSAKPQFEKVVRIVPIESYDVFAVLGINQTGSSIAFLGFDGTLRECVNISNATDMVDGDFNQKTREFIIAFQNGIVLCLFLKVISKTEYHLTRRRNTKIGTNDQHNSVVQVVIQDLINNVLLLLKKGHIVCLGIDRFDILFSLSSDLFAIKPTNLIADKFGTDFLVQCTNSETNKEQLEYWHPPTDYGTCRENLFGRITIPLSAQILGVGFESLGLFGAKTLLSITTLNKKVQLWSASGENTLLFQADLKLNNPPHLWEDTQTLLNAGRLSQDVVYTTLHRHCAVQVYLPMPKMDDLTYQTLFLTTIGKSTTFVGVHTVDLIENAMSLVMMDLEIKRMQESTIMSQQQNPFTHITENDFSLMPLASKSTTDGGEKFVSVANEHGSMNGDSNNDFRSKGKMEVDGSSRNSPLNTGRRSPLENNIPINSFGALENADEVVSLTLQKMERDVKTTAIPAQSNALKEYPDVDTKYFFPSYYIANKDLSKCNQQYANGSATVLNRLVYPNFIYTDKNSDLFSFNLSGLKGIGGNSSNALADVVPVKYFSFANRAEQVLIVSEVKDCLLYHLQVLNVPPLRIPISLRLQAKITVAICCDVTLRSPAPLVQVASKSKMASAPKVLNDIEGIYTMVMFGDDQGFVHLFICDSANKVLQSDMFRAHSCGITHIVPTGDCCRLFWTIGTEYVDGNLNVIPLCVPGSAFVTVSKEGEFKTWLPQEPETRGTSYDRFFLGNVLKWKLSGVFTSLQSTTILNNYAQTYELLTDSFKKAKTIETVVLAPSCMNLLVGYSNGLFEEWHIPGLIDSCDSVLATSQRPIWSTILHSDGIVSCRVHTHTSLSMIKEVTFPSDRDRDKVLATLTSFVRVSNRVRRTVGITFQEAKMLTGSSSIVTCSNDRSLVLWGLQPTFFQHCSFLHPIPCKKFYFSGVPLHGIAFCLNTQTSSPNSPHNVWRLDAILEGKIITVISEFRGRMFSSYDQNAIEDHRLALGNTSYILSFDDDLLFEFSRPTTGISKRKSLSSIPVIGKVSKASILVGSYQTFDSAFRNKSQDTKATYPFLMSASLLEEWAKVIEHKEHPVLSSLQYTQEEKDEHIPLDVEWKAVFDPDSIPPRAATPIQVVNSTAQKVVVFNNSTTIHQRPSSPATIKMEIENIAKYPEPDKSSPIKKFTHNGIYMQAKAETFEKTLNFLDKTSEAKFVLDKFNSSVPSGLNPTPSSHENDHTFSIRQYDFPVATDSKSVISFNDDLTVSTTVHREDSRDLDNLDGATIDTGADEKEEPAVVGNNEAGLPPTVLNLEMVQNNKDKEDNHSVITEETGGKGKDKVHQTKSSQLRQQVMMKAKERMDLVDNYNGPAGFGDSRKSTKSYYTSKNSMLNEDNKQFQGGTKQPLGTNTLFAPPANNSVVKAGIIVPNSVKETPEKPPKKPSAQLIPDTPPHERMDGREEPPPTAEPGKLYYAREKSEEKTNDMVVKPPSAASHHSKSVTAPQEEVKQKYVVQKAAKSRPAKPLAPRKHPAGHRKRGEGNDDKNEADNISDYDDDDDDSSFVSLESDDRGVGGRRQGYSHPKNPAIQRIKIFNDSLSHDALKHHPAIPPVPGPQSLFLDLPDQRMIKRRRHALQLVKNLADRGVSFEDTGLEKLAMVAQSKDAQKLLEDDTDDSTVMTNDTDDTQVSTYFDRSAKPIFVERKKPEVQTLKSRKNTPKTPGSPKRLGSHDSDDDSTSSSKVGGMDAFLKGMTDEDRLLFDGLDENARKKLMDDMRNSKMTGKGQNKMLKQLTKKALEDAKETALLSMDLTLETLELNDLNFTVSISSVAGGAIYVVLVNAANSGPLSHKYFANDQTIASIPGYCEHRKLLLGPNSYEEICYENLRPSTQYIVLAVVNLNSLTPMDIEPEKTISKKPSSSAKIEPPSVDTSKITNWWNLDVETKEEQFDIEWERLDQDMRITEIRAAIRNEFVQAKAFFHFPSIILPNDDEVQSSEFKALLSPSLDTKNIANLKKKLKPHLLIFYEWWVGQDKSKTATKIRSEYQSLECIHAILQHKKFLQAFEEEGFATKEDCQLLVEYVKKNTNQKPKPSGSVPATPAVIGGDTSIAGGRAKSIASGFSGDLESASAKSGFPTAASVGSGGSAAFNERGLQLMKIFRSWYKGGQVVRDKEEEHLQNLQLGDHHGDDNSLASSASEGSIAFSDILPVALPMQRLAQRTEFLKELIENLVEATDQVNKLWEGYKIAVGKSFRESDLIYERANLTPKDLIAITAAKKFLELCMDYAMFSAEMEAALVTTTLNPRNNRNETPPYRMIDLSALDAFQSLLKLNPNLSNAVKPSDYINSTQPTPTPPFIVIQRLSGADIFRVVDVELLKPDDPPPVNIQCLPGTNRRPIRPWQLMSNADQDLEIAVACSLDMIWELSIVDCIEVPVPEDRLLDKDQFPIRRRIWEEFREWYAGEEETNKIPGQGIPTLARVLFAEEYEMKHVENDDGVMNLMREKNLALPRKFRDIGVSLTTMHVTTGGGGSIAVPTDAVSVGDKSFNDSIVSSVRLPSQSGGTGGPAVGFPGIPENSSKSTQSLSKSQSQSMRRNGSTDELETMGQAYERAINTNKGSFLRPALLSATLNTVLRSRRMNTLKYFWPPGMNRLTWQYLFPRCGFIIPPYSLPLKRYQLFASRSRERYNVDEIMAWYSTRELDNEDAVMMKAEAKGVKLRAYHEWLAKEPERLAYSRMNMELEDSQAYQRRQVDELIAKRFADIEQKLLETDEYLEEHPNGGHHFDRDRDREFERAISFSSVRRSDSEDMYNQGGIVLAEDGEDGGSLEKALFAINNAVREHQQFSVPGSPDKTSVAGAQVKQFRFLENLPKEYWYIFEESVEFKYSSGIYNEDEVEEMKEMQKEAARKAVEDALAFERSLHEEKKKRDMEERMRLKREEQDRRLKEGVARRRMIRESHEEIKRQRLIKQEEEILEAMRALEEAKLKAEEEEKERAYQLELERIEAERLHELEMMGYEELLVRELLVRKRELQMMEHEDITSFLREQLEIQEEIEKQERIEEITRIYEPFQPYQFKQSRIKRPALHDVLRDSREVHAKDAFLEGVRTSLHSNGSASSDDQHPMLKSSASTSSSFSFGDEKYFHFLALQEHETQSASRHRSKRYDLIYGDTKPSAELDSILASRGLTSHLHTPHHHRSQNISRDPSQPPSQMHSQLHSQLHSPRHRSRTTSATSGEMISSPKKGNNLLYRELGHSPTKKQVRDLVGSMIEQDSTLPFNPYSTEWEIGDPYKHVAPVLLDNAPIPVSISAPYFSRPVTRGGLTSSGPVSPGHRSPSRRMSGTVSPKRHRDDEMEENAGTSYRAVTADHSYSYGDGEYEMDEEGNIWYHENSSSAEGGQRSSTALPVNISLESVAPAPTEENAMQMTDSSQIPDFSSSGGSAFRAGSSHRQHHPSLEEIQEESAASDSWFNSQESSVVYQLDESLTTGNKKGKKTGGGRKKMKELLALSADVIAKSSQQEWLDFIATQKKLTMASLVSLDARSHAKEMNPILASLKAQQRAAIINATNTVPHNASSTSGPLQVGMPTPSTSIEVNKSATTPASPGTTLPKKKLLLKKEDIMSQSAPMEFSLIDAKTKKLGKSASETVLKLQQQRAAIRQYVSGNAILGDNYFMEACQPGIRNATSLEANEEVQKFALKLQEHLEKEPHDNQHNMEMAGVNHDQQVLPPLDSTTPKSARGKKDKKGIATSLNSLTTSEGFMPHASTASKINVPLQTRVIPSKSTVNALVTGSSMKIEKDIKRQRLKPIGPQKSASASALPSTSALPTPPALPHTTLSILNDPLVASALSRPPSEKKSIELSIVTPEQTRVPSREDRSTFSLDSKPLPSIK